jgi:subtilisin
MRTALRLLLLVLLLLVGGRAPRASAQANQPLGYRVLIGFAPAAELQAAEDRANIIRQAGGIVYASFALIPAVSAWVPAQALEALSGRPDVAYVEEDVVLQAFEQTTPWGVGRVHANLVWPGGNTGAGIDVAILDTGIDSRHPDLVVVDGVNYSDASGTPGSTDPADWNDNHGHGTHCAGIVAALNNSVGVVGVAPGARLHAVKVLDDSGLGYTSDIIQGLEWCVTHHMHVASLSLGGGGSTSLQNACDEAFAAGVLLVAAAGNAGGPVSYPAAYPSVIAVSATDAQDQLASFSNFGPEIALAAPGVNIYSTYKGGSYATLSGTSMACPHVTGVAALVWAAGAASNTAVRDVLTGTAEDLGTPGRDTSFGYGLVDAQRATGAPTVEIENPAEGATVSGVVSIKATARGANAIVRVEFLVDAASIGFGVKGADGWWMAWDTTVFHNGAHQVVATAVDTLGQTASQSIKVVVDNTAQKPPAPRAMHVSAIDMWATTFSQGYAVYTKVVVLDNSVPTPQAVSGATVSVTTSLPSGRSVSRSAITGADGAVTLPVLSARGGTFTSTVTAVTGSLTYDPATNLKTTESCTVP